MALVIRPFDSSKMACDPAVSEAGCSVRIRAPSLDQHSPHDRLVEAETGVYQRFWQDRTFPMRVIGVTRINAMATYQAEGGTIAILSALRAERDWL